MCITQGSCAYLGPLPTCGLETPGAVNRPIVGRPGLFPISQAFLSFFPWHPCLEMCFFPKYFVCFRAGGSWLFQKRVNPVALTLFLAKSNSTVTDEILIPRWASTLPGSLLIVYWYIFSPLSFWLHTHHQIATFSWVI